MNKALNTSCLQKLKTQTPMFVPNYKPHVHVRAFVRDVRSPEPKYEGARSLRNFIQREEQEILQRYEKKSKVKQ